MSRPDGGVRLPDGFRLEATLYVTLRRDLEQPLDQRQGRIEFAHAIKKTGEMREASEEKWSYRAGKLGDRWRQNTGRRRRCDTGPTRSEYSTADTAGGKLQRDCQADDSVSDHGDVGGVTVAAAGRSCHDRVMAREP